MHMENGGFPVFMGGPLTWILWILLGLLVFWLLRSLFRGDPGGRDDSPLTELQRRFARGEIDDEEFRRRRRLLRETDRK